MSWGTDFKTDIYLSHQTFSSKMEVQDKINELTEKMSDCISQIKMYVASSPNDIISNEFQESPIGWLNNEMNDLIDSYNEDLINRYKLDLYLEYLDYCENKNTEVDNGIRDILFEYHSIMKTKEESQLSGEEFVTACDILINDVIDRIKSKLLTCK